MNQGIDSTLISLEARWHNTATQYLIHPVGVEKMTQVVLGENEGIESALRRFKRQVSKAGILADARKHRHFETPIEKRRRKAVAKRRKKQFRY